ncbi:alpha/beta hydrolase [Variovorax sp. J22R133]|uniref:alpha/beta fold hydrolase n=1 Tax=Variovorax brevis TaxID=3053503 RepID=UPI002577DEA8|nr:alpha/beta hydrolase [Variovorax sp. J22R133]MDM0111860.1 alpha/beta hydrolase [Variovorax sp. J22R133]
MYTPRRVSRSEFIPLRGLDHHVRIWGELSPGRPPIVMLHGWMDVGASFQFVVDALASERPVIAPDWRGFGLTDARGTDNFWFPDYLADLDGLLDHYLPDQAVDIVGHSMGGNVSMFYAGARPQRVRRMVNLEGFGMPQTRPEQAPARYARWMDELKQWKRGELDLQTYPEPGGVARRLMRTNPRLSKDKADWLASHWAGPTTRADGSTGWGILGDAAHKIVNANLYRVDEAIEIYKNITAPVLAVDAVDGIVKTWKSRGIDEDMLARLHAVPGLTRLTLQDAGHMLHHDQPGQVAAVIEAHLNGP